LFSREMRMPSSVCGIDLSRVLIRSCRRKSRLNSCSKQSAQHHIQAMIEAGLCYFSGEVLRRNKEKAVEFWSRAAALGNLEAQIRLAATNVIADLQLRNYASSIPDLDSAAHKGRSWRKWRSRIATRREPA